MKYIDSNAFIYPVIYYVKLEPKVSIAKDILIEVAGGTMNAATAVLSYEVMR